MKTSFRNIRFRTWTFPLALLAVCLAAFGLLIPWLGFYWDDWPVIFMSRFQGAAGFWEFYQHDRPISAWTYILTAPLLGLNPAAWHIFSLLLRWLTALGMGWSLAGLWPSARRQAAWAALLFAVYPVFTQQSIAVAYSQHWITYGLYFLSLGAMIQSIRRPRYFWPLTLLSLLSGLLHMMTMEYFLGLELLRPLVLWFLAGEGAPAIRPRLQKAARWALPYLLLLATFVVWRLFFLDLAGEDPNRPEVLYQLLERPLHTLAELLETVLQDLVHVLFASWYPALQPQTIEVGDRFLLLAYGLGAAVAVLLAFYLPRLRYAEDAQPGTVASELPEVAPAGAGSPESPARPWLLQAALLGVLALALGPLPAWLTGRQIITGLYGSRFALAAMFGASLLIIVFLEWLSPRLFAKAILLGAIAGLAVSFHLRTANEYRWIWVDQTRFYWQLAWRAPYIEPGTTLVSEGELFPYVGYYSTAMGVNLLYPRTEDSPEVAYWFLDLYRNFAGQIDLLLAGAEVKEVFRSFEYSSHSQDSLVISYAPEEGRCLWVLGPFDQDNRDAGDLAHSAAPISNLNRIHRQTPQPGYPPTAIFGPEPEHTWCYYFQKAELARQYGEWDLVASLGKEVIQLGYDPNDNQEWLPFIEGFAHTGAWDRAEELTRTVANDKPKYVPRLCSLWDRVADTAPAGAEKDAVLERIRRSLACAQ